MNHYFIPFNDSQGNKAQGIEWVHKSILKMNFRILTLSIKKQAPLLQNFSHVGKNLAIEPVDVEVDHVMLQYIHRHWDKFACVMKIICCFVHDDCFLFLDFLSIIDGDTIDSQFGEEKEEGIVDSITNWISTP